MTSFKLQIKQTLKYAFSNLPPVMCQNKQRQNDPAKHSEDLGSQIVCQDISQDNCLIVVGGSVDGRFIQ